MLKSRNKTGNYVIIIILAINTIWYLWSGIWGLFLAGYHSMEDVYQNPSKKEVYSGYLSLASKEYCSMEHTLNGLIPTGTEHYYLAFSSDKNNVICVRAPKNWDKDFTDDYINTIHKRERGMIRELDHEVRGELLTVTQALTEQGIQVESQVYLDLTVNKLCYMQLFVGISFILLCVFLALWNGEKTLFSRIVALLFLIPIIMDIHLLSML